jgi:hypothetical protein
MIARFHAFTRGTALPNVVERGRVFARDQTQSRAPANEQASQLARRHGDGDEHYATQRVRAVIDDCAITAEWTGRVGDKGMNLSAFDGRTREWRQMYVSNQVPAPLGVTLRRSDPSYDGPGVRFISLLDPPAGTATRSRVTIMPLSAERAVQLFEDSKDGGATWHVIFKAEHRRLTSAP